ncbi:MAG: hypothetical protein M3Y13_04820, partial [Armatimonadota bacterium]|nr:hypothetical protein [Armatimonadota bacterium]
MKKPVLNEPAPDASGEDSPAARRSLAPQIGLLAAICVLAVCGFAAGYAVRLDYGPDEPYHMEYVHVLAFQRQLPLSSDTLMVQHPPPYYALMSLPWRLMSGGQRPLDIAPGPDALAGMTEASRAARHVLRGFNTLIACLTLLVLARLVAVVGVPPSWRPAFVCVVAAWPMFQYVSGVVNNENAAILFSSVLCLALVNRVQTGHCSLSQAVGIGLLVGGGLWIKQTTMFAAPLALWVLWTVDVPAQRVPRIGLFLASALAVGIWWPLHNHQLTGEWFPHYSAVEHQAEVHAQVLAHPLELLSWTRLILETSFLPDWSWMLLPRSLSTLMASAVAITLGACFWYGWKDKTDVRGRQLRGLSLAALLLLLT